MSRIDRFLFCLGWEDLFLNRSQVALPRPISDHTPIVLEPIRINGRPSPFCFEEVWFLEPDFLKIVEREWNKESFSGNASRIFSLKLKALKYLKAWNKTSRGSLKLNLKICA